MKAFLVRRWFLIALSLGIVLAWVAPQVLAIPLKHVNTYVVVFPCLFLMAWSFPTRKVYDALRTPWPALWAVFISYTIVPLTAFFLGMFMPIPDFAIGLLISASVPCTLASAVIWTRMGGGNEATALLVIILTNCLSWLLTTAWLGWATEAQVNVDTQAMMRDLLLTLVLPMSLGQLCRLIPTLAHFGTNHKLILSNLAQFLILLMIWKACGAVGIRLLEQHSLLSPAIILVGIGTPVLVHLLALTFALGSSRLFRFSHADQVAVAFASSQKTLPVAILLYDVYFAEDYALAILPLAFYHFGQLIVDTFIADRFKKNAPADPPSVMENAVYESS